MAEKLQPTMLDLVKTERPIGAVGEWRCPGCGKAFRWRLDHSRLIEISDEERDPTTATPARLGDLHVGFLIRVQQEVEQHIAEQHGEKERAACPS